MPERKAAYKGSSIAAGKSESAVSHACLNYIQDLCWRGEWQHGEMYDKPGSIMHGSVLGQAFFFFTPLERRFIGMQHATMARHTRAGGHERE